MAEDNNAMAEEQIGTTLVFNVDQYLDYEPFERVAEAIIESGRRRVDYLYDINSEGEHDVLEVYASYYLDGELVNEATRTQEYRTDGDVVYHAEAEYGIQEFIESNAFGDPEVTITDEFESMVNET